MFDDPFFKQRKPHTNDYLESLHRTYNKLPERNDAAFKRALEYRQREKDRFSLIAQENQELRDRVAILQGQTSRFESLWTQLSKQFDDEAAKVVAARARSSPVHVRTEAPRSTAPEVRPAEVQLKVLPTDDQRDTGGPATEHGTEGSEQRSGVGTDSAAAEPEDTVQQGDE